MIKIVLWDVDGTLLDFGAAERAAIRSLFSEYGLGECTDSMLARYSAVNAGFWQRLERGELTKPQILTGRFEQFFREYGLDTGIVKEFNDRYQLKLGDTIVFRDDSPDIIRSLKGRVKQYAVSNGTIAAQTKKLDRSGLGALMDGVFLSEELGAEKPSKVFFEKVFAAIRPGSPSEVLIVGDSLTSDILGGMNAGIRTCWYDPEGEPVPGGYRPDYVIADLHEVADCLDAEDAAERGDVVLPPRSITVGGEPMTIEQAGPGRFREVRAFYHAVIDAVGGSADSVGWKKDIYPAPDFLKSSLENGELFTVRHSDTIVGAMVLNRAYNEGYSGIAWPTGADDSQIMVVHALAVLPPYTGKGCAREMVRFALDLARDMRRRAVRLDVLKGNLRARRLYTGMGFGRVATLPMFYEDTGLTDFELYEYNL